MNNLSHLNTVKDHNRVFQEFFYVYPVISRRSRGLSIGINLNPDKVCNFDCVYCEVDHKTPPRTKVLDPERIRDELAQMARWAINGELESLPKFQEAPELTRNIRDFAFSGDGEPTMIPNFALCIQVAADVKQTLHLDHTKIVLITNTAGLDKADVKRGLEIMDANNGEIWGKLDAGTPEYYQIVNRSPIRFERILANLLETARKRPIVIQSLFLNIHGQGMTSDELKAYCQRLKDIVRGGGNIKEVHAYTVARPTPEAYATRLEPEQLHAISRQIQDATGLPVFSFE